MSLSNNYLAKQQSASVDSAMIYDLEQPGVRRFHSLSLQAQVDNIRKDLDTLKGSVDMLNDAVEKTNRYLRTRAWYLS